MAALAYQKSKTTGKLVAEAAASGGGDTIPPNERGALQVRNADASSKTVTIAVPGAEYGQNRPDIEFVVTAGSIGVFGPLPDDLADPNDGLVHVTYSAVTNVKVAAVLI